MINFIDYLEKSNELIRISEYVDPVLQIAEITDRISKSGNGGKALLFENTGTNFPVLINAYGSSRRIAMALGVENISEIADNVNKLLTQLRKPRSTVFEKIALLSSLKDLKNITPKQVKRGICQEIIIRNPDLNLLPILKTWPLDGGKFITLPLVNTRDPLTGIRNLGMYRMQVFDKNLTGMHWHKHKVGARHYQEHKKTGEKMPVAVALGGDPIYTYTATAPLPDNIDEYLLAGFLRKKPVKLVKAITQNIHVPADADIVIEGYVDPNEELIYEGPFGDHTGFYSLPDYYPKFHVTCITHKKNAIYPATLVGIPPQEDAYFAKATEKLFLPLLQKTIASEIIDMHLPESGVAHNFTIFKIKQQYEGQALKIMNSMWGNGQMTFNKFMFVTNDTNINIHDYEKLAQQTLKNFDPKTDIYYAKGPLDVLDHSAEQFCIGSKIGFDLTNKKTKTKKNKPFNENSIKNIKNIKKYTSLLNKKIPILIIAIEKKERILKYARNLINTTDLSMFKIIIFVDENFDTNNIYTISWIVGSNTAPQRDTAIIYNEKMNYTILAIDATTKNKEIDKFNRQWPPIIKMDNNTIKTVDKKWEKLNIGPFIKSPSL